MRLEHQLYSGTKTPPSTTGAYFSAMTDVLIWKTTLWAHFVIITIISVRNELLRTDVIIVGFRGTIIVFFNVTDEGAVTEPALY